MNPSLSQSALLLALSIPALGLSCWAARYPKKTILGIGLGVLVGVALLNATSFLVGFLGYVLPFRQLDFWLASLLLNTF